MIHLLNRRQALTWVAAATATLASRVHAQADRTIKFILPNATGSGVDAITRSAAPALAKSLGHAVVVENQAGASGVIGLQALTKNPPDGFTLVGGVQQRGDLPQRHEEPAVQHAR
jgi:tripartite-type tricarboxylate transporter receptor subunit TctC